jgi:predicted nucleic acid-binding protein
VIGLGTSGLIALIDAGEPDHQACHRALDTDLERALGLVKKYRDHPIGFSDATLAALCERLNVKHILALDRRHFQMFRDASGRPFKLLP